MSQHGVQCFLKQVRKLGRQVENKRRNLRPKMLSTADEHSLKVVSLRNRENNPAVTQKMHFALCPTAP